MDVRGLIFELGQQQFAIKIEAIQEVLPSLPAKPVPQVPAIVEGVVNLRGSTLPVLDIRSRFGLPPKPLALSDHLVVVRIANRKVALRVDRATTVVDLSETSVTDIAEIAPGSRHISGVARLGDDIIFIQNTELFLREAELAALADFESAMPC